MAFFPSFFEIKVAKKVHVLCARFFGLGAVMWQGIFPGEKLSMGHVTLCFPASRDIRRFLLFLVY